MGASPTGRRSPLWITSARRTGTMLRVDAPTPTDCSALTIKDTSVQTSGQRTRRRPLRATSQVAAFGATLALAACSADVRLEAHDAAEKYEPITEEVARAITQEGTALTGDTSALGITGSDDGCWVSAGSYASGRPPSTGDLEPPDAGPIVDAAQEVLSAQGFAELELDDDYPMPMQIFTAHDDTGGRIHLTIESRPSRPAVTLRWSAQVDTRDQPCDERLLH